MTTSSAFARLSSQLRARRSRNLLETEVIAVAFIKKCTGVWPNAARYLGPSSAIAIQETIARMTCEYRLNLNWFEQMWA
jgi:hypothetical protein